MIRISLVLTALFSSSMAFAQSPSCIPQYTVKYGTCVLPTNPMVVQTVTTDWILVNKGARHIQDGICMDHVSEIAAQNPSAQNVRFESLEDRDASFRGIGKRDVYCKFSMEIATPAAAETEACGIVDVVSEGCPDGFSVDVTKACLSAPLSSSTENWKRAACLVESFQQAPRIAGMDRQTYSDVEFQLDMMMKSYATAPVESQEHALSDFIADKLGL